MFTNKYVKKLDNTVSPINYNIMFSDGGRRTDVAYGSFKIFNSEGSLIGHRQLVYGNYTSNYAEYTTLHAGLKFCLANDIDYVFTFIDSELVYMQVYGYKDCIKPEFIPIRNSIRELIYKFEFIELHRVSRNFLHTILGH